VVIIRAGMAPQLILLRAIEGRAVLKVDLSVRRKGSGIWKTLPRGFWALVVD
jgi:hypothetical protein